MSNRSLVELNHDYCPRDNDAELLKWARSMRRYMTGADTRELPQGVTRKHYRHHSTPDPMDGRTTPDRVRILA